jgi:hypothetical protein
MSEHLDQLPKPKMTKMPAASISTDDRFQRDLIPSRVRRIAAELDLDGIGIITTSRRNGASGAVVVIDGQHRLAALAHHEMSEWGVECREYSGLTLEQEAALFRRLNDTRRITAYDDFKAGLVAGDPECKSIVRIAREAGFKVKDTSHDGYICCVSALRYVYRQEGGAEILARTLEDARAAWGTTAAGVEKDLVRGLALLHQTYGDEIDRPALIKKLAKAAGGPSTIIGSARGLKQTLHASIARCVAMVIVGLYNKGRRSGTLSAL